jgi:hypothetical protein
MKKNYLSKAQRAEFTLSAELKAILIGLILGDLGMQKRSKSTLSVRCCFGQGLVHKEYLLHLYELFKPYGSQAPLISHEFYKRTGKEYGKIRFYTYTLPCFNELYELFYPLGKKIVPANIVELVTPLSLAYWIAVYGSFCQRSGAIFLHTQGFTLEQVNLLVKTLTFVAP